MVIGILGVLKTGASYVPMEPGHPAARLRYMMEDAGLGLVITSRELREAGNEQEREREWKCCAWKRRRSS